MSSDKGETLTEAMLASLPAHLRPTRAGKYLRAGCPFHGSNSQRSLSIDAETGRFQCFSCGAWGYTERARDDWKASHQGTSYKSPPWQPTARLERLRPAGEAPAPLENEWLERLAEWRKALPEAAEYLAERRIPLDLVERLGGGVGYFGQARRLVLPHTEPQGRIVSLYGRRIDGGETFKHYHLGERPKGFLNAQAVNGAEVWLTEGAFDALALMAAGIPNAAAVFGVNGIRWDWLKGVRRIVLALDADDAGRKAILEHARQALMRGVEVLAVMPEELGPAKDIAEAWQNGTLNVGQPTDTAPQALADPLAELRGLVAALPDHYPGLPGEQWARYRGTANRFMLEHGQAALAAGWTPLELFGVPDGSTPWNGGGALWDLTDYDIREVTPTEVRAVTSRGAPMVSYRAYLNPCRLPWG